MRLFTGLEMPEHVESELDRIVRPWREVAPGLQWSPLVNLHITTKFIGEWPEARLTQLVDALVGSVPKPGGALRMAVRGVGWFPNPDQPRSLFAAVDATPQGLHDLVAGTQDALAAIGIAREERKYAPHVTLARMNRPPSAELSALRQAIAESQALDFGVVEAKSFFLYLSQSESRGSIYKKLAEFSFQ